MFGLFTYIKIALAVVVIGVVAFFAWSYHHRGVVIEQQKIQIANLEIEKSVLLEKEKTEQDFAVKKDTVRRKVTQDEKVIDDTLSSGDATRVLRLWDAYRLHADKVLSATDGRASGPQFTP